MISESVFLFQGDSGVRRRVSEGEEVSGPQDMMKREMMEEKTLLTVAGGCFSVPRSSAILLNTCGPPTKASFGPTGALAKVEAGAVCGGSTSPGAMVKFGTSFLFFCLDCRCGCLVPEWRE